MINKYGSVHYFQSDMSIKKRLQKYEFQNEKFDSYWELVFFVYHVINNINIKREPTKLKYLFNNETHYYYPDFEVNGKLYEIKGDQFFKEDGTMQNPFDHKFDSLFEAKHQCGILHNVIFIKEKEIQPYIQFVENKFGKNFRNLCKVAN